MFENFSIEIRLVLDILISAVLGFAVGFERKLRSKEAGIRTHTIVCVGAALMMVVSKYAFGGVGDPGRIAAQIVTGIGFLGAGIIVYKKNEVRGLTTAAGVWSTAGIGMACGGGLYFVAIGATIILIAIQWVLHRKVFSHKRYFQVEIKFIQKDVERNIVKKLFGTDRYNRLVIERKDGVVYYHAILNTDVEYSSERLDEIMRAHSFIISLERCENE